jgi:hypothetical protein
MQQFKVKLHVQFVIWLSKQTPFKSKTYSMPQCYISTKFTENS